MNYIDVQSCVDGNHGNELLWECGDVTENLQPPKQYVPWVLVNDVLYDEDDDFEKSLISAYEVSVKQKNFSKVQLSNQDSVKKNCT